MYLGERLPPHVGVAGPQGERQCPLGTAADLLARFEEVRRGELLDAGAAEVLRAAYI